MRRLLPLVFALSLAALAPSAATAQMSGGGSRVPAMAFLQPTVPACFARSYTAEHMRNHPRQQVTDIAVVYVPTRVFDGVAEPQWYADGSFRSLNIMIAARVRSGPQVPLLAAGNCQPVSPTRLDCGIDEDGGIFTLRRDGERYFLDNDSRLIMMPDTGRRDEMSVAIARADDHASFRLSPSRGGLCDAKFPPVDPSEWN